MSIIQKHLAASAAVVQAPAAREVKNIESAARSIGDGFLIGGELMLCGNGGGAAQCQHVAAQFVTRRTRTFNRVPLPAIALTTDMSFLTAFANDGGYEGMSQNTEHVQEALLGVDHAICQMVESRLFATDAR